MTRKRFIKLGMSMGWSRNFLEKKIREALKIWNDYPHAKFSYDFNFKQMQFITDWRPECVR